MEQKYQDLINEAFEAVKKSYAPYSKFNVGAALLTKDHKIYHGCNIENAGLTATNCAERTAFFKAVSEGDREFEAIAIVGGHDYQCEEICPPCGVCRQVMMEFCDPATFKIFLADTKGNVVEQSLEQMLPYGFGPKNL